MSIWRVVLAVVLMSVLAAPTQAASKEWRFKVYLDEREIGYHHFRLAPQGGATRLTSEAEFEVKFLFVKAYDYAHRNEEIWNGACLAQLHSSTDDNGTPYSVEGSLQREGFVVRASGQREQLSGCVRSFAYWSPEALRDVDRLLNPQTGEYVAVRLRYLGRDTVDAGGASVSADRYRLEGADLAIDLWYAGGEEWVALESQAANGARLRYRIP